MREKSKAFQFKQFAIAHDRCAMKVGTDGVLVGAWCSAEGKARILDVGTGSGLIALMVAQRSKAQIVGIEIDHDAAQQAHENAKASPFAPRITIIEASLQRFQDTLVTSATFDLIVSNPPYFTDSLKAPSAQRSTARHTDSLSFDELVAAASALLSPSGVLSVILPTEAFEGFATIATAHRLHLNRITHVRPTPSSPPRRILMEWSPTPQPLLSNELIIETDRHRYSESYNSLTAAFYLKG